MLYRELADAVRLAGTRLAVYGTLAPGECNHYQLDGLSGTWTKGKVRGERDGGWAIAHGYPGLVWNPDGPEIAVQVFESPDLPAHWKRLDEFEGADYQRILIPVEQDGRLTIANIYALAERD